MKVNNIIILVWIIILINALSIVMGDNVIKGDCVTKEGELVNSGFVFLDGKYINSPYIVSQRGFNLYINDILIPKPTRTPNDSCALSFEENNGADISSGRQKERCRIVQDARRIYERFLKEGCAYLFFSRGGHIQMDPYDVAYSFPSIINLLVSPRDYTEKFAELRTRGWDCYDPNYAETFINHFVVSESLVSRIEKQSLELLRIKEFGEASVIVDKGIIFMDGRYLDAPYTVTRKGLGVFINNELVERPMRWPVEYFTGDTDPMLSPEIDQYTSFDDPLVQDYLGRKWAFAKKNLTGQAQCDMNEQALKSLPFMKSVKRDDNDPHITHIETVKGRKLRVGLVVPRREIEIGYDAQSTIERVETKYKGYQGDLEQNKCYFLSSGGGRVSLSNKAIKDDMPKLIEILNSSDPLSIKRLKINGLGLHLSERDIDQLLRNTPSVQLDKRIKDLNK